MSSQYCLYLRKSRADLDAEAHGAGDTLARHERILLALAKSHGYSIGAIYRELASGERISTRPVVQQLLSEVESGRWAGVLVTETSRLARGDSIDQGLVAQAFKYSKTFIITPQKIFDPSDEMDEEWFEIGLFMSRQEYRMIRRRQRAGAEAARREGRYLGNIPPYGYERVKLPRGYTLKPIPDQAKVVRMIYDMYLSGMGYVRIADRLNELHIPGPKENGWKQWSISTILQNPHYAGYTSSGRRPLKKIVKNGKVTYTRPRNYDYELYEGLHEAIVDRELWDKVQNTLNSHATARVNTFKKMLNPLSGLLICDCCGMRMQRKSACGTQPYALIRCPTRHCPTVTHNFEEIEQAVLQAIRDFLSNILVNSKPSKLDLSKEKQAIRALKKKLSDIESKISRTYDLVEDGTYTKDIFLSRQSELNASKNEILVAMSDIENKILEEKQKYNEIQNIVPHMYRVLDAYEHTDDIEEKNDLLKSVIDHIDYHKRTRNRWSKDCDLSLTIHPRIHFHSNNG